MISINESVDTNSAIMDDILTVHGTAVKRSQNMALEKFFRSGTLE